MPLFGYARVSTRDQNLAAQDAELMAAGCAKVFKEKVSGAKTDRPELAKVIGRLEPGDVLVVTRLDRLARSTRDLLNVLDELSKRGVGFKSLKDAWADTTTPHAKLMLTVLGGLAEFERELIRARARGGSARRIARPLWPAAQDDAAPAPGSAATPCRRRDIRRRGQDLQRRGHDHRQIGVFQSFRAKRGRPVKRTRASP